MDASTIRLILIVVGAILIVALYLWERRREQRDAYHDDYDDDLFEDANADEPYGVRPTRHTASLHDDHDDDVDVDAARFAAPPAAKSPGLWQRLRGHVRAAPAPEVEADHAFAADAEYDDPPPIKARAAFAQSSNPTRPKARSTQPPVADAELDIDPDVVLEPVRPVKPIKSAPPEPEPRPEPTPRPRPAPPPEPAPPPPPPAPSTGVKRREVTVPDPLLIQFSVSARRYPFKGPEILEVASGCGLHPGEMEIFHCFDTFDDEIRVYFSMANMVKPGRFPFKEMEGFSTPGLVLFAQLEGDPEDMTILDEMLATARKLALSLNGDVLDSTRRPLTVKKEEELRQAVLDNERRWQRVPRR